MTDKEKIRAEIERLNKQSLADENRQADRGLERAASVSYGKSIACKELLSFINSLPDKPVSEDLEEAAENYAFTDEVLPNGKVMIDFQAEKAFKAGSKWQKERTIIKAIEWLKGSDIECNDADIDDFRKAMED